MEKLIFKKVTLQEEALMEQIFRLRLHVYGKECGFIHEEDYPDGLETDEYDPHATHFAAINSRGEVVGSLRMIISDTLKLPVEKHCSHPTLHKRLKPNYAFAEISRLVVSKALIKARNHALDAGHLLRSGGNSFNEVNSLELLEKTKPLAVGLCREVFKESVQRGITHWYALMEKSLWYLLRIHGFAFECVGGEIDVYGPVKPYVGKVTDIEKAIKNFQLKHSWTALKAQNHPSLSSEMSFQFSKECLVGA